MTRNLSAVIKAELATRINKFVRLIDATFEDGQIYLNTFVRPIVWGGKTWQSGSGLLGVQTVSESLGLEAPQVEIVLNGLNQSGQALVLQQEFTGNPVDIYLVFLDKEDNIIGDPYLDFQGLMNGMTLTDSFDSQSMTLSIPLTFEFSRFEDVRGRRTNASEQKKYLPYDTGMDSVAKLSELQIDW